MKLKIAVVISLATLLSSCTITSNNVTNSSSEFDTKESAVTKAEISEVATAEPETDAPETTSVATDTEAPGTTVESITEAPEPTTDVTVTEPDDSQLVLPDDSYVGIWIFKGSGSINIISVDPNFVKFEFQVGRGPRIEGTAVRQGNIFIFNEDVSPDLVYTVYYGPAHDGSSPRGHLEFRPDSVALIFDEAFDHLKLLIGDTRLTEPEPVIPNQKYIGKWTRKHEINGEVLELKYNYLSIRAVEADKVIFGYYEEKGLELETVAIKKDDKYVFGKDISPYMEFDHYIKSYLEKCSEITGSLVFYDDEISITMSLYSSASTIKFNTKESTTTNTVVLPEPEPIIPNQKYIGKWTHKLEINGEVFEFKTDYLSIRAVEADKVIFGYYEHKGLELETVAIKKDDKYVFGKDISPYMEFDHYIKPYLEECNEITGSLVFYDDSIDITMSKFGRTSTLKFDTKYETGTSPKELPEEAEKIIDDTIAILEEKGWSSIIRIKIEPDGLERWGVEIPPYDPEYNTVIYNLLGSCNGVDVVVRIVYDEASELWKTVEAFYASESGKVLRSEELEKFMKDHGKTDFILPPDDTDLVEYFK